MSLGNATLRTVDHFNLTLAGQTKSLPFSELPAERSPHTGRLLRHVHLLFTVEGEETNDAVVKELSSAQNPSGAMRGDDGKRWLQVGHNWSYTAGTDRYEHHVELREAEILNPTRLEFAGLSLVPDRYGEEIVEGRIMIMTILEPDEEADRTLEAFIRSHMDEAEAAYFPLRRLGISNDEISVRLGNCLRERPSRGQRHRLVFVQSGDEEPEAVFAQINQPDVARAKEVAAAGHRAISTLVSELRVAGVLSEDAEARIFDALRTDNLRAEHMRRFSETDDLDAFFMH